MERINLANVLCGQGSAVYTLAGLNPADHRTRCFKRAAASYISERIYDPDIVDLGHLSGNTDIDWETPYTEKLDPQLQINVNSTIAFGLEMCRTQAMALVAVANHDFDRVLANYDSNQANEFIRQVVCGIVAIPESTVADLSIL